MNFNFVSDGSSIILPDSCKPDKHQSLRLALVVPNLAWGDWDINSRWRIIPYNLCLLAAAVRDICDVVIIDANLEDFDDSSFMSALSDLNPDVVGISVLMDKYGSTGHHAARITKGWNPKTTVLMGGVYATVNYESVIKDPCIDYVVVGEGEHVLRELLSFFLGDGSFPSHGVVFRENGKVVNKGHAKFITDLDQLPLPAYDKINFSEYVSSVHVRRSVDSPPEFPYARVLTSRGCPYNCVFCQVGLIHGRAFRPRTPDNVLREIEWLRNEYGVRSIIFDDDNLFTNVHRASSIFKGMIERDLAMPWVSIATPVFKLNDELIKEMRQSGCEYIDIAIESGVDRVLKEVIGKPVNLGHALKMARKAQDYGIFVAANFVIGFPTETWDEIRQTISYAERINVDYVKIFTAIPLRHTRLWKLCEETNSFKKDFSSNDVRWDAGQIETSQFTARDLSILRAFEWDRINFSNSEKRTKICQRLRLNEEELFEMRRRTLNQAGL